MNDAAWLLGSKAAPWLLKEDATEETPLLNEEAADIPRPRLNEEAPDIPPHTRNEEHDGCRDRSHPEATGSMDGEWQDGDAGGAAVAVAVEDCIFLWKEESWKEES